VHAADSDKRYLLSIIYDESFARANISEGYATVDATCAALMC
jgi:hypothetical protein